MGKKIITIVGMGPGVSYSVAKKFGKEGFSIAMIARHEDKLNEYKKNLERFGYESYSFKGDAGDEESLKETFSKIKNKIGDTDVLVYNAASVRQTKPTELKYEDCVNDFKINVAGALLSSQLVLPVMLEKQTGTILFTGGILALEPFPAYSSLGIGKAGIRNLCFSLYAELKSKKIHVATVTIYGDVKPQTKFDPDIIAQEYWKLYIQKPEEFQKEIIFK